MSSQIHCLIIYLAVIFCRSSKQHINCLSLVMIRKFPRNHINILLEKCFLSTFEDYKCHQKNSIYMSMSQQQVHKVFEDQILRLQKFIICRMIKTEKQIYLLDNYTIILPLKINTSIWLVIYRKRIFYILNNEKFNRNHHIHFIKSSIHD